MRRGSFQPVPPAGLLVEAVTSEPGRLLIRARPIAVDAAYPECDRRSDHEHSQYERRLMDLPSHGRIVQLRIRVRRLPRDFPPYSTVQDYFDRWAKGGMLVRFNHALVVAAHEAAGREAGPTAAVVDSQLVKTTECGGPRGCDAGKKIKGRKQRILTETLGFLVGWLVHPANIQDHDSAAKTLATIRRSYPWLRHIFADGGDAGDKLGFELAGLVREVMNAVPYLLGTGCQWRALSKDFPRRTTVF